MIRGTIFSILLSVPLSVWFTLVDAQIPSWSRLLVPTAVAFAIAFLVSHRRRIARALSASVAVVVIVSLLVTLFFDLGGTLFVGTAYAGGPEFVDGSLKAQKDAPPQKVLLLGGGYTADDALRLKTSLSNSSSAFDVVAPGGHGDTFKDALVTLGEWWGMRVSPAHGTLEGLSRQSGIQRAPTLGPVQVFGYNQGALTIANFNNRFATSALVPRLSSLDLPGFGKSIPDVRDEYTSILLQAEMARAMKVQLASVMAVFSPGAISKLGLALTTVGEYGPQPLADLARSAKDGLVLGNIVMEASAGEWGGALRGSSAFALGKGLSALGAGVGKPVTRVDVVPYHAASVEVFRGQRFERSVSGTTRVEQVYIPPQKTRVVPDYFDGEMIKTVTREFRIQERIGPNNSVNTPSRSPSYSPPSGTLDPFGRGSSLQAPRSPSVPPVPSNRSFR